MNTCQLFLSLLLIGTIFVCQNGETDAKAVHGNLKRSVGNFLQVRHGKTIFPTRARTGT